MATVVMSSYKVIQAARAKIDAIRQARKDRDERLISDYMRHGKRVWLFWFKQVTREEAIKYMKEDLYGEWDFPSDYHWGQAFNHAHSLLKLAQHGDPVTLNEKDTDLLF